MKVAGLMLVLLMSVPLSAETPPASSPAPDTPSDTGVAVAAKPSQGVVRKITTGHGNLITTLRAAGLASLDIKVGQTMRVRIGESEYEVLYGNVYEDAPAGGWVAVAKAGDLVWIACNGGNAAETANARVGTPVEILFDSKAP